MSSFEASELALLRDEPEIEIETSAAEGAPLHRAVIWVVVDDRDRVLIRSYRGPGARWFRESTAHPEARVHIQGRALDVRAMTAADQDRIAACSEGLQRKYAGDPSMPRMLQRYLQTTLELVPR